MTNGKRFVWSSRSSSCDGWNNGWLKPEYTRSLPYDSIVNQETLKKVTPVIMFRETRAYNDSLYADD